MPPKIPWHYITHWKYYIKRLAHDFIGGLCMVSGIAHISFLKSTELHTSGNSHAQVIIPATTPVSSLKVFLYSLLCLVARRSHEVTSQNCGCMTNYTGIRVSLLRSSLLSSIMVCVLEEFPLQQLLQVHTLSEEFPHPHKVGMLIRYVVMSVRLFMGTLGMNSLIITNHHHYVLYMKVRWSRFHCVTWMLL